jgi:hypothetical protein
MAGRRHTPRPRPNRQNETALAAQSPENDDCLSLDAAIAAMATAEPIELPPVWPNAA